MLVWLEPVQVMQLRFVCQAYREEARKAIQVVGLIDDYENHKEAMSLGKSFAAVWRVCWGAGRRPSILPYNALSHTRVPASMEDPRAAAGGASPDPDPCGHLASLAFPALRPEFSVGACMRHLPRCGRLRSPFPPPSRPEWRTGRIFSRSSREVRAQGCFAGLCVAVCCPGPRHLAARRRDHALTARHPVPRNFLIRRLDEAVRGPARLWRRV